MISFAKTGEYATILLIISSLSGLVVAYHYELAEPFVSTVAMDSIVPWGNAMRSLHFYSSQMFLGALSLHVLQYLKQAMEDSVSRAFCIKWTVTGMSLVATILALFTGYVLRFDSTGQAAGAISENLLLAMPLSVGRLFNSFLISISNNGLTRVYAAHLGLTCLIWSVGVFYHTKKLIFKPNALFLCLFLLFCFSCLVSAPLDQIEEGVSILKGPWFFLGVQELLLHLPPFWAGIVFPAVFVGLFLFLPWLKTRKRVYLIICVWSAIYLALSIILLWR